MGPIERAEARKWLAGEQGVKIPDHVKDYLAEVSTLLKQTADRADLLREEYTRTAGELQTWKMRATAAERSLGLVKEVAPALYTRIFEPENVGPKEHPGQGQLFDEPAGG